MKVLISVGVVLIIGVILVIIAIMAQQPSELTAEQTTQEISTPEPAETTPEDTVEIIATITEQEDATSDEPINVTLNACRELESRLQEDVEDVEREMNRKLRDYEKAKEKYEQTLDVDNVDPALLDQYRNDQKAKEAEHEDAKKEHNGAVRRLYEARDDCGFL